MRTGYFIISACCFVACLFIWSMAEAAETVSAKSSLAWEFQPSEGRPIQGFEILVDGRAVHQITDADARDVPLSALSLPEGETVSLTVRAYDEQKRGPESDALELVLAPTPIARPTRFRVIGGYLEVVPE